MKSLLNPMNSVDGIRQQLAEVRNELTAVQARIDALLKLEAALMALLETIADPQPVQGSTPQSP